MKLGQIIEDAQLATSLSKKLMVQNEKMAEEMRGLEVKKRKCERKASKLAEALRNLVVLG